MRSGGLRRQMRMPRRKGAARLFAAHRLTVSCLPLGAVLGAVLGAWRASASTVPVPARTGGAQKPCLAGCRGRRAAPLKFGAAGPRAMKKGGRPSVCQYVVASSAERQRLGTSPPGRAQPLLVLFRSTPPRWGGVNGTRVYKHRGACAASPESAFHSPGSARAKCHWALGCPVVSSAPGRLKSFSLSLSPLPAFSLYAVHPPPPLTTVALRRALSWSMWSSSPRSRCERRPKTRRTAGAHLLAAT